WFQAMGAAGTRAISRYFDVSVAVPPFVAGRSHAHGQFDRRALSVSGFPRDGVLQRAESAAETARAGGKIPAQASCPALAARHHPGAPEAALPRAGASEFFQQRKTEL